MKPSKCTRSTDGTPWPGHPPCWDGNSFLRMAEDIIFNPPRTLGRQRLSAGAQRRGNPSGGPVDGSAGRRLRRPDAIPHLQTMCCSHENAISVILKEKGKAFDPDVVGLRCSCAARKASHKIKSCFPDHLPQNAQITCWPECDFKEHLHSPEPSGWPKKTGSRLKLSQTICKQRKKIASPCVYKISRSNALTYERS